MLMILALDKIAFKFILLHFTSVRSRNCGGFFKEKARLANEEGIIK